MCNLILKFMSHKKIEQGLVPLNSNLNDEVYVKELEQRLETDPLGVGGLLDFCQGHDISLFTVCDKGYEIRPCGGGEHIVCSKGYSD